MQWARCCRRGRKGVSSGGQGGRSPLMMCPILSVQGERKGTQRKGGWLEVKKRGRKNLLQEETAGVPWGAARTGRGERKGERCPSQAGTEGEMRGEMRVFGWVPREVQQEV